MSSAKRLLFTALILFIPSMVLSQQRGSYRRPAPAWEVLLKGGWQSTSFLESTGQAEFSSGWHAGVAFKAPLKNKWWLQPEIMFNRRNALLKFDTGSNTAEETSYTFSHVAYPILLVYRISDLIEVQAGPQFAVLLGNRSKANFTQDQLTSTDLKKWELGFSAGLELNVSPLAIGLRYQQSAVALASSDLARQQLGADSRLHGIQLYGALVF